MADIIASVAWNCGEHWHQSDYWVQDNGTYTQDAYTDGDHEDISEDAIPSCDEIDASWKEYAAYVAEQGEDPLGNFLVPEYIKKTVHVRAHVNASILGPTPGAIGIRHGKSKYTMYFAHELMLSTDPICEAVRDYLLLVDKGHRIVMGIAWEELVELFPTIPGVIRCDVEAKVPNPKYREQVIKAARRAM